jgi:UDP-N-acetylglucosamine--N-acetylmuramyl-(pentapeptide) pyrophosphoryl-undecaprenol N-acetylglucosamine transferase
VGNLVDVSISNIGKDTYPNIRENSKINILILGGSQGARILSKVIPQSISKLSESMRSRLKIVQQCREEDIDSVRSIYSNSSVDFFVDTFFVDMDKKLSDAHFVIARSGASTVAELVASGRPSILIPISISNENHQLLNAKILSDHSAAWIIEEKNLNPNELCKKLTYLLSKPESLKEASKKARSLFTDARKNMLKLITGFGTQTK